MPDSLVERFRTYLAIKGTPIPFPPAPEKAVGEAELALGLTIPPLLKACYLSIGNGGYGPGYGIIGVEGGYSSDYGDLVSTRELLKNDQESEGNIWPDELLPFCEWGCNIFSCVDCINPGFPVYTFENFGFRPAGYTLDEFFELWMKGVDILSFGRERRKRPQIKNPFTRDL